MIKSTLVTAFLLATSFTNFSHANEVGLRNDPALIISSVEVSEVETVVMPTEELPNAPTNPIDEIAIMIDSLLAIGKKIWPIIEAGRPVITNRLAPSISILPHLDGEAPVLNQMENWSIPKVKSFRVSFKNGFGSEVVGFTYTIFFQYNGDLNGVGKYVTSLKVQASEIYTAWGFNFDAVSELLSIANVGTKGAPVASGIIEVAYVVKGMLNESRSAQSFYVDGNGNIQILNN